VTERALPPWTVHHGDALTVLRALPTGSVHCCVTSPPYWGLRDYECAGQLGQERTPEEFIATLVEVFRDMRRVLRPDGTLWLNLGDSYRAKQLLGLPWRMAFALQSDGWYLRSDIVWAKPNPIPEAGTDRPTKAHDYLFLLSASERYYYDAFAIREHVAGTAGSRGAGRGPKSRIGAKGCRNNAKFSAALVGRVFRRNKRSVWTVPTHKFHGAHFATFPPELVQPCIRAGTSEHGVCAACGAPWRREVRRTKTIDGEPVDRAPPIWTVDLRAPSGASGVGHGRILVYTESVGWRATCGCGASVVPAVVLDPFAGACTTGVVACREGRRFVGIEIKREYVEMGRQRILSETSQRALFAPLPLCEGEATPHRIEVETPQGAQLALLEDAPR